MDKQQALETLRGLINRIDTQDNRATAAPFLHLLNIKRRQFVPAGFGDGGWWRYPDDFEIHPVQANDEVQAAALLIDRYKYHFDPEALEECDVVEWWETENVFLTQQGYERHMEANGHNIKRKVDHEDYLIHAFRNRELSETLEAIRSLVKEGE